MNQNATSGLEASGSVDERRARWEGANYRMVVCANGYVNVANLNYNESGHIYSVRVEDGEAVGCSCPHHVNRGAHCKHQIAVENRPLVVSTATAANASYTQPATEQVAADGGEKAETCENGHVGCPGPYHLIRAMCDECRDESRADLTEGVVNRTFGE